MILEREGYNVMSALGFSQAEMQCRNGDFDLMILGHSIPLAERQVLVGHFRAHCCAPIVALLRIGEPLVDGADFHFSVDDPGELVREIGKIVFPVEEERATE
jgi:hypothetical protein